MDQALAKKTKGTQRPNTGPNRLGPQGAAHLEVQLQQHHRGLLKHQLSHLRRTIQTTLYHKKGTSHQQYERHASDTKTLQLEKTRATGRGSTSSRRCELYASQTKEQPADYCGNCTSHGTMLR